MSSSAPSAGDIPKGQTRCIFICGGSDLNKDLWQFADFMALSKTFMATGGIKGTYLNLFPYKEWFDQNPAANRVAWGYKGANAGEPLLEYRRGEASWWQQVSKEQYQGVPGVIEANLRNIAKETKWPDVVNIFIISHGSPSGRLSMGGYLLRMSTVDEIVANEFNYGVQVNVVVHSCFSGILKDKIQNRSTQRRTVQASASAIQKAWSFSRGPSGQYRGSPFVAAYAESMMRALKDAEEKRPERTLKQHFSDVNLHGISLGMHDATQTTVTGNPESWSGREVLEAVLNVLFRDYTVVTFEGGTKVKHRVLTPPQPGPQPGPQPVLSNLQSASVFSKALENEIGRLVSWNPPSMNDHGFAIVLGHINDSPDDLSIFRQQMPGFMNGLRWRLKIQERYLLLLDELLRDELIDMDALTEPIDIGKVNSNVENIISVLECYRLGASCTLRAGALPELQDTVGEGRFEMPIRWLAILIVRSQPETEMVHIITRLDTVPLLGTRMDEFLDDVDPFPLKRDARANIGEMRPYELGFMLPATGGDLKKWAAETWIRYDHIARLYEELFGKGTWGDRRAIYSLLKAWSGYNAQEGFGPGLRKGGTLVDHLSDCSSPTSS
jgi:hypothetical protein